MVWPLISCAHTREENISRRGLGNVKSKAEGRVTEKEGKVVDREFFLHELVGRDSAQLWKLQCNS